MTCLCCSRCQSAPSVVLPARRSGVPAQQVSRFCTAHLLAASLYPWKSWQQVSGAWPSWKLVSNNTVSSVAACPENICVYRLDLLAPLQWRPGPTGQPFLHCSLARSFFVSLGVLAGVNWCLAQLSAGEQQSLKRGSLLRSLCVHCLYLLALYLLALPACISPC